MTETITFQEVSKKTTFTCKKTLLEKCPDPSKYTIMELNQNYEMLTYLHNETGPALSRIKKDGSLLEEYWIDGKNLSVENPELADRIKAKTKFEDKFNSFINDEPAGKDGV